MKSPFCIVPLLLLQFINLTWALPWDLPTCPLPAPPPSPAQRVLSPDVGVDGSSSSPEKKTNLSPTKIVKYLPPRQVATTTTCLRTNCDTQYYCCNDQTCSYQQSKWVCLWATRTVTVTSTYQSTTTSISTTTRSITTTTWDTRTVWTLISTTGAWTTTITVTRTPTETSYTASTVTLRERGMPTPTRCVRRPEEEEEERRRRKRGLAKRSDFTYYVTTTIVVTATPASTLYLTTTWLYTYWITGQITTTHASYIGADRTLTETSTYLAATTTTTIVAVTTTKVHKMTPDQKVGAGVGGGVGGLAVIALVVALIWKKRAKPPTAPEQWASNQPVEDRNVPPGGGAGLGMAGVGGMALAAGATYKDPYKAGYYGQDGNVVMTETPSSQQPQQPPPAHFQPVQYPQRYPGLSSLPPPIPPPEIFPKR